MEISSRVRIVVAIEPRYYREVIASAIEGLMPHVEVRVLEPGDKLEEEVARLEPELVICEHPTAEMVHSSSTSWVEFRPYEEESATKISVGGRYRELEHFELKDLLWVVEEVEELSRARRGPTNSS